MKKNLLVVLVFLISCAPVQTTSSITPTDIPDIYPTPLPTPTLAVITKAMSDGEKEEALNFFYEQKNNVALGEYEHFAEEIRYPITVMVDGKPKTYVYIAEFEADFEKIFNEEMIQRFISIDESELNFTPNGVKVADGVIWFDLICFNPECEDAEFLITVINN